MSTAMCTVTYTVSSHRQSTHAHTVYSDTTPEQSMVILEGNINRSLGAKGNVFSSFFPSSQKMSLTGVTRPVFYPVITEIITLHPGGWGSSFKH